MFKKIIIFVFLILLIYFIALIKIYYSDLFGSFGCKTVVYYPKYGNPFLWVRKTVPDLENYPKLSSGCKDGEINLF